MLQDTVIDSDKVCHLDMDARKCTLSVKYLILSLYF